jgi:Tfp pilus assembly protein PilV
MTLISPNTVRQSRGIMANTLPEVMISVVILAIMFASLYAAFNTGFGSMTASREEMRATQIMTQKLEAIRLLTWAQMSNAPTSFQEYYDSAQTSFQQYYNSNKPTNSTAGCTYYGTISYFDTATNVPSAYQSKLHVITVTVTWTNGFASTTPIAHTRSMQTISAYLGLQNYIYGQ